MIRLENTGYILKDPVRSSPVQVGKFKWSVPNLIHGLKDTTIPYISSPRFSFKNNKWFLTLLPSVKSGYPYTGLFLWNQCSKYQKNSFRVKISIENSSSFLSASYTLQKEGEIRSGESFGIWHLVPVSDFKSYPSEISPNGNILFNCEITKIDSNEEVIVEDNGEEEEDGDEDDDDSSDDEEEESTRFDQLLQNLEKMFLEAQNADMTLKIENEEIPVHKGILSVRSPVFASMLEHDMQERNSNVVDIPDCSVDAFKIFLLYLYTGKTDAISVENVFGVYYAADKYQVNDLMKKCTKLIKKTLSVDNFCEVITLSFRHTELNLLKAATRFFCKNIQRIIITPQWQVFLRNYPTQANELFIKSITA